MSIQPARYETHGPVRKVVGVKDYFNWAGTRFDQEVLECGHDEGRVLREFQKPARSRRCWRCRWLDIQEEKRVAAEQALRFDVV